MASSLACRLTAVTMAGPRTAEPADRASSDEPPNPPAPGGTVPYPENFTGK